MIDGQVGRFDGFPVYESREVETPQVLVFPSHRKIICRYKEDVPYRIKLDEIRKAMRADLWRQLHAFAARVGVKDW